MRIVSANAFGADTETAIIKNRTGGVTFNTAYYKNMTRELQVFFTFLFPGQVSRIQQ